MSAPGERPRDSRTTGGIFCTMGRGSTGVTPIAAILLILVGAAFFLNNIGWLRIYNVWEYWPIILIVVGVLKIQRAQTESGYITGGLEIAAGILFQLYNLGLLRVRAGVLWPMALVAAGLVLLLRPRFAPALGAARPANSPNVANEVAVFAGVERLMTTRSFQGGELLAIFGGINLDLRNAEMLPGNGPVRLEANAIFGGIEIRVPDHWRVTVTGTGVFGGYDDKTLNARQNTAPDAPLLNICGSAVFGGVNVQ